MAGGGYALEQSEAESQRREHLLRQRKADLAGLAQCLETGGGEIMLGGILIRMGLGRQLAAEDLPAYNLALQIFADAAKAQPAAAANILRRAFGVGI